jgi:hypothetical protein
MQNCSTGAYSNADLNIFGVYQRGAAPRSCPLPATEGSPQLQMLLAKLLPPTAFADSSAITRLAVLAVYGLLVFGGAALTYAVVEKPAREWLRQVGPPGVRLRRQTELSPSQALL